MNTCLAIDIGGTNTSVAAISDQVLVDDKSWRSGSCASEVLEQIQIEVASLLAHHTFDACGIGFGGQFSFAEQRVMRSIHVPGWHGVALSSWLENRFGLPTVTDNDANVGGLGEARFGAGRGSTSVVYLTISTGLGGSHLLNGRIQRGSRGLAGEYGHITLDANGPECGCGLRGCAERMLSGLWLKHDHGATAERLFSEGTFLDEYANHLAGLLQQITMVLDPDVFILGGGIGASSPVLATTAQEHLEQRFAPWDRQTPLVRMAGLGGNSVLIGAGQMAKERYGESR